MTFSRSILVVAASFGLLLTAGVSHAEPGDEDPWGSSGNNGLPPADFTPSKHNLWTATSSPFNGLNAALDQLSTNTQGLMTLPYVVKCALPGDARYVVGNEAYLGAGILATTSGWLTGGLAPEEKGDLFACMAAHLNPFGTHIPVRLTGEAVENRPGQSYYDHGFTFPEALWIAYETPRGMKIEVRALPELVGKCHELTSIATHTRVCDWSGGACGVDVKEDLETVCSQDLTTNNWTCNGHRAIESWLRADDWLALYPGCGPIPQ